MVDVETTMLRDGEAPRTKFWGLALDGEGYRRFKTTRSLWRYLSSREGLLLYHHHDFDPLQALSDGAPLTISDMRGSRILRSRGPAGIEWRNSYALFEAPLASILAACGFEKPGLEDLEARNRADTVDALEALQLLGARWEKLWGVNPIGGRHLTAAGVTFAAAQKVAGPLPRHYGHRESYRGGRVEAFRLGDCGEAESWDVGSSYPFAFVDLPRRDTLYKVRVDVEPTGIPPFALHQSPAERKRGGKLLFPGGCFTSWVWGSSYERYIRPHATGINSLEIVDRERCDFTWLRRVGSLMHAAYAARKRCKAAGDEPGAYALKIGLNSIYGRLGMKPVRQFVKLAAKLPAGDVGYKRLPDGRFLTFCETPSRPAVNYLFASAVTCNARARLWQALVTSKAPVYCDTDSVYCAPGGFSEAVNRGTGLGEWALGGRGKLRVFGAKDYTFRGERKLKGGRRSYTWTIRQLLKAGVVRETCRIQQTDYDKRVVLSNGTTAPLEFWQ